jgi:hypothetical protein
VLEVQADGRSDSDGVDVRVGEHLLDARERTRDAVPRCGHLGALESGIAECCNRDTVFDVVMRQVGQDAAQHERTDSDHADPKRLVH